MKLNPQALKFTECVVQANVRGGHNIYFRDFEVMNAVNRIQRARARNLVHWLRYKATLEFDVAMGIWSGVRVDDALKRSKSCRALADRIAAKYLGGKV